MHTKSGDQQSQDKQ